MSFNRWERLVCTRLTIRSQRPVQMLIWPGLRDMYESGMSTKAAADTIYPDLFLF